MELALYAPGVGYYERQREIGKRGDFFTSVSTGSLFGELLAFQFGQWFDHEDARDSLQIIEAGAHDGRLAADILGWLQRRRPDLFCRIEYVVVEPSAVHRAWQEQTLRHFASNIKWTHDVASIQGREATRIIFANELLDAMPVHRFAWDATGQCWNECLVTFKDSTFAWIHQPSEAPPGTIPELAGHLPDGYIFEHSPAAAAWWKSAAAAVHQGILLTLDYGMSIEELFRPERRDGTLRTYSRHHPGGGLLEHPGECDITGHVNFTAIEDAGLAAGLATKQFVMQEKFLTGILAQTEANPPLFDPWTPSRIRQFQTLANPAHLGSTFRVLVQSRGL